MLAPVFSSSACLNQAYVTCMSLQHMLVFTQDSSTLKPWATFYFRLPVASCISDKDFESIEQFAVLLYSITSPWIFVNECRKFLFTKKCCPVESIRPTKATLEQHIKRAILQSRQKCKSHQWSTLDSLISKAFYTKIKLFMKQSLVCT